MLSGTGISLVFDENVPYHPPAFDTASTNQKGRISPDVRVGLGGGVIQKFLDATKNSKRFSSAPHL